MASNQNQFEQGNSINITGVSGNLDFDIVTEELKTGIDVWTFSAGLTSFNVEMTAMQMSALMNNLINLQNQPTRCAILRTLQSSTVYHARQQC